MSRLFHNWIFSKNKKGSVSAKTLVKEVLTELDIPFTDACCPTDSDPENLTNRELTAGGVGSGTGWGLEGNAGTDGGVTNFIGTTDDVDVVIKRNDSDMVVIEENLITFNTAIQINDGDAEVGKHLVAIDTNGTAEWQYTNAPIVQQILVADSPFAYTPTPGTNYLKVQVQAAGGSGGVSADGSDKLGTSGGAGAYLEGYINIADVPGGTFPITVTVGAGGAAVATNSAGANGTHGADSSFGALIVCQGGRRGVAATVTNSGGLGGSVSSLDAIVNEITRLNGASGRVSSTTARVGGDGGDSFLGRGGNGNINGGGITTTASVGYGAGGSGTYSNSTSQAGAAGTDGIVIITEYF